MKILHFIYGLNIGGAETFVQNILENLDLNKYKIEFAIQRETVQNRMINEIINEKK